MTDRRPTPAEQAEIDAFQNGVYGAEPPQWWLDRAASIEVMIRAAKAEAWEQGMTDAKLSAAGIKPARNPYLAD
jgi:hypothetical protein